MSEKLGDKLPAPLRFDLGFEPRGAEHVRAVLLATVDEHGCPRIAVLAPHEIRVVDDRTMRFQVYANSTTSRNLARTARATVWCVLDAAAYSIQGAATQSAAAPSHAESCSFDLEVSAVLRDFEPQAPMISGPTYKRL